MINYKTTKVAPNLRSIVKRDPYKILLKKFGKRYEEYRKQWKDTGNRIYLTNFPTHLDLDITDSCNLACWHCPQSTYQCWSGVLMEKPIFEKILSEAEKGGAFSINIGQVAEPLVNKKHFLEMLNILNHYKIMDVFLHTNVVNLTEEIQRKILKSKITTVCFSLGAVTDKSRKKHLAKIKEHIINFKQLRDKAGKELPLIRVGIIPTKENIKKVPGFLKFWKEYSDYIELQDAILLGKDIDKFYKKQKFSCNQPWRRLAILSNGDIYPCCGFTVLNKELKLGNIKHISLREAWNSKKIKDLREGLKSNKLEKYPGCLLCLNSLYTVKLKF